MKRDYQQGWRDGPVEVACMMLNVIRNEYFTSVSYAGSVGPRTMAVGCLPYWGPDTLCNSSFIRWSEGSSRQQ